MYYQNNPINDRLSTNPMSQIPLQGTNYQNNSINSLGQYSNNTHPQFNYMSQTSSINSSNFSDGYDTNYNQGDIMNYHQIMQSISNLSNKFDNIVQSKLQTNSHKLYNENVLEKLIEDKVKEMTITFQRLLKM